MVLKNVIILLIFFYKEKSDSFSVGTGHDIIIKGVGIWDSQKRLKLSLKSTACLSGDLLRTPVHRCFAVENIKQKVKGKVALLLYQWLLCSC